MEGGDQCLVELKHWFAARDHHQAPIAVVPKRFHPAGELIGLVAATILAIQPDEVGVAEGALGAPPVALETAPQIAAGKAKEDGPPPCLHPLPLQGEEDLLDRVAHA